MRAVVVTGGIALVVLGGWTGAYASEPQRPSIDDIMALRMITSAEISPDGSHVAFAGFESDFEADKDMRQLWLVPVSGGKPVQLTHGEDPVGDYEWSADSAWIAFMRDDQLNVMRRTGGEPMVLDTDVEGASNLRFSPDGAALAFVAGPKNKALIDAREERYGKYEVFREEGAYEHLWVMALRDDMRADGAPRQVTTGRELSVIGYNWSPDGSKLAFTAWPTPYLVDVLESQIYVVDANDGAPEKLTTSHGDKSAPIWNASGRALAFTTAPGFPNINRIAIVEANGQNERILDLDFPGSPNLLRWDGDALLFSGAWQTSLQLYRAAVGSGSAEPVTESDIDSTRGCTFSSDASVVACLRAGRSSLSEIVVLIGGGERQLTDMSAQLAGLQLPTKELIRWESDNGLEIEGVLTKPHDFQEGRRYPLYVRTHGGPTGTDRPWIVGLPRSLYPPAVLASQGGGALVLQTNYRGSDGYGEDFQMSNLRNLGVGPARDIIAGVEMLTEQGLVDPDRVACLGWSQGGHISAMLSTYSDICTAAIMGAGISDWRTYYYNTDITQFTTEYFGATPLADDDVYAKTSPVTYIDRAKTPVLIQHGENDHRVPIANGYQFRQLLLDKGVEARMIVYQGMGHGPSTPRMRRAINEHALAWFDEHLYGADTPDFVHPVPLKK